METFYYNPTTRPSSIGARAEVLVSGGSLAVEVILEALLLHASVRAEELAGGRGGAGAVAQARDGPPGLMAWLWGGGARQPLDGEAAGRTRPDCTSTYCGSFVSDMRG